jgi:hypothetical protein
MSANKRKFLEFLHFTGSGRIGYFHLDQLNEMDLIRNQYVMGEDVRERVERFIQVSLLRQGLLSKEEVGSTGTGKPDPVITGTGKPDPTSTGISEEKEPRELCNPAN